MAALVMGWEVGSISRSSNHLPWNVKASVQNRHDDEEGKECEYVFFWCCATTGWFGGVNRLIM